MNKEIKSVIKGEYSNPKLDEFMSDVLYYAVINLDMSYYMNLVKLREQVITDRYFENIYEQEETTTLGL